jgi:hypothetical protein
MNLPPPEDDEHDQSAPWLGLGVAVLIVVIGVCVMIAFKHSSNLLDCVASGRHNCAPVDQ